MRLIISLFIFSGISLYCWGQPFKGTLFNENNNPVPYANVILLSLPDSTLVKGAISNEKGFFEIQNTSNVKNVALKITHIEYKDLIIRVENSDLGKIILKKSFNELGEVVISVTKPIMKQQGSKIITDISSSSLRRIPKVDMLLNFLPGVSTSYTGNGFEVFGKGNALFFINNKRVRDINDVYRLSPQEIDKIELDTQPGAEHDNRVGAIIRIILKKKQGDGWSGNINAEAEFKKGQTSFVDANLNYRTGKTDIFFTLKPSFNFDFYRENTKDLLVHTPSNNWQVLTNENVKNNHKNFYVKTGFSHEFNNNHSFGVSLWGKLNPFSGKSFTEQLSQTFQNKMLVQKSLNDYQYNNKNRSISANAYYEGKVSEKIKLQTDVFYTGAFSDYDTDILERNITTSSQRNIKASSQAKYGLWSITTNFLQKIEKNALSYGIDASILSRSDDYNNNLWGNSDVDNSEKKLAGFASYSFLLGKTNFKAGLRYEYTDFEYFEKAVKNNTKSRSYNNWLPNVSVSFPYDKTQWNVSYAKQIRRPSFYELSDRSTYETSFLFHKGNANISPYLADNFSVQTTYKKYSFLIDYKYIHNGFYQDYFLLETDPNIVVRTIRNFDDYQVLKFVFSAMHQVKFWISKLDVSFGKQFAKNVFYWNKPIWGIESMNQFILSENTMAYLFFNYQSKGSIGNDYFYKPQGLAGLMMAHSFFNKKLEVYAGIMDIFNTLYQNTTIENKFVTNSQRFDSNVRSFRVGLEYRFNPTQSKYKGKGFHENEKNRL